MPSEVVDGNGDDRVGNCRHSYGVGADVVTLYDSLRQKYQPADFGSITAPICALSQIARRNS